MSAPRLLALGEAALSLDFGARLDPELAARVRACAAQIAGDAPAGVCELVPTTRALLVIFDPRRTDGARLGAELRERAAATAAVSAPPGRRHLVPVHYGGEHGPDLAAAAHALGLSPGQLVQRHAALEHEVLMLGFLPGFAYLGPLPAELRLPRRATPRARVPAGSVAMAAEYSGVYAVESPGGWHLLGRTRERFFDAGCDPPARLRPGDRVRFVPVEAGQEAADPPAELTEEPTGPAGLEVLDGGWLTSVQDAGRFGWRDQGVSWSGALDSEALAHANRKVGNPPETAALECTLSGPTLRVLEPCVFALAGAEIEAWLERRDLGRPWRVPPGSAVRARPGNLLRLGAVRRGCRAYLAFAGGVDVPLVLGSRSTDLKARFGGHHGRALRAGDRLAVGCATGARLLSRAASHWDMGLGAGGCAATAQDALRVRPGPQAEHFTAGAWRRLLETVWAVSSTSDRTGCRLEGPRLEHAGAAEIVSDGLVPGCIQVPPDGLPIVALADGPTTGGYPKIATVLRADLARLAQAVPGQGQVRFALEG